MIEKKQHNRHQFISVSLTFPTTQRAKAGGREGSGRLIYHTSYSNKMFFYHHRKHDIILFSPFSSVYQTQVDRVNGGSR